MIKSKDLGQSKAYLVAQGSPINGLSKLKYRNFRVSLSLPHSHVLYFIYIIMDKLLIGILLVLWNWWMLVQRFVGSSLKMLITSSRPGASLFHKAPVLLAQSNCWWKVHSWVDVSILCVMCYTNQISSTILHHIISMSVLTVIMNQSLRFSPIKRVCQNSNIQED